MNSSAEEIKQHIINTIARSADNVFAIDWEKWHIGITIYPNQEKRDLGKPIGWKSWKANSPNEAVEIRNYFLNKYPINRSKEGRKYDYFVFIFKK